MYLPFVLNSRKKPGRDTQEILFHVSRLLDDPLDIVHSPRASFRTLR